MKSISELNPKNYKTTPVIDSNLSVLFQRIMELQEISGMDFQITSALRSMEHQEKLIQAGKSTARKSYHLSGDACDIYDPEKKVKDWCIGNLKTLEAIGLWMEHPDYTPNWCHLQSKPPRSGNRVFIP